jgi:hypothetical protein
MTEAEDRALFVATMRALGDWAEHGGNLAARLADLARAAVGDVLPGEALPIPAPRRKLDDVARRGVALELVRREGRVTSGRLAMAAYCSDETARTTLGALARRGVLRQVGRKRGSMYVPGHAFGQVG